MLKFCNPQLLVLTLSLFILNACNSGTNSGNHDGGGSTFQSNPTPPTPFPPPGTYNGKSYTELGAPNGLANNYPADYLPNNLQSSYGLQIAFGKNNESTVTNLAAFVSITQNGSDYNYICSATPVHYNSTTNTTFLVGAAHCFVTNKNNANAVNANNLLPPTYIRIYNGLNSATGTQYTVKAIYIMQNYCYGATYKDGYECANFSPKDEINSSGQGNDLAIIEVNGIYADPNNYPYPQVVESYDYPKAYTMAPVLSVGYGINTQTPLANPICTLSNCAQMFYVANYFYWQQDATGYHYLYNSYYNTKSTSPYFAGYSSLICGGDSGGGDLFWDGSKWLLLSEHTYGPDDSCGSFYPYLPNGATNVSAYYNWIQNIINSTTPTDSCKNGTIRNCVTNI